MYLTPRDGNFSNISILCVNVSRNAGDNAIINMQHIQIFNIPEYVAMFTFNIFDHNTPIIFVLIVSHLFLAFGGFFQKSSELYRVMYIAFLDYAHMHFSVDIYI